MLSYSPGGISFESAPFKLTRELLEARQLSCAAHLPSIIMCRTFAQRRSECHAAHCQVMDSDAEGCASDAFNYFKVRLLEEGRVDKEPLNADASNTCRCCAYRDSLLLASMRSRFCCSLR